MINTRLYEEALKQGFHTETSVPFSDPALSIFQLAAAIYAATKEYVDVVVLPIRYESGTSEWMILGKGRRPAPTPRQERKQPTFPSFDGIGKGKLRGNTRPPGKRRL